MGRSVCRQQFAPRSLRLTTEATLLRKIALLLALLNVVLLMEFPRAYDICEGAPERLYEPMAHIEINLPANAWINGFVFVLPFLSEQEKEELRAAMRDKLGYDPDGGHVRGCSDTDQEQFDQFVAELIERVESGQVDSPSAQNIFELRQMAESIIIHD
jgi:hypothetical protein